MKKIKIFALIFAALLSLSSCLKYNLEELPAFSDAEITGITSVEYRYISDDISPVNGDKIVKFVTLTSSNVKVDAETSTCTLDVAAPSNFPTERLSDLSLSKLVVIAQLSTAAVCTPVDGSPAFGVPGDWSKPNKYQIKAADGTTKVWTVTVNSLKK